MMRHSIFFTLTFILVSFINFLYSQEVVEPKLSSIRGDVIWTGNSSEEWNDPLNWDLNEIPGTYSDVTIPSSPPGGNYPLISAETEAECNTLTIEQGSLVQIKGFLTVHGSLSNADQEALVMLSDESGTGSLIHGSGIVAATVQRYLTDGTSHFIGAAVDDATLQDLFFNSDPIVFLYQYIESAGDWTTISDLNTPIIPGKGYSVYVSDAKNRQDVTAVFTGHLRTSDLELSGSNLSYTSDSPYPGSNLISNPFSSALSWDLGNWQAENVSGSIWLWNGAYNYLFRNAHGMGSLTNGIIPVSQAFFVRATATDATLTLSAADRVHSNQNFYKSFERDNEAYIVLEVEKDERADETWVAFCEECSDDEDIGWDTEKLYGTASAPQLYFKTENKELSIEAIPLLGDEIEILKLYFEAGESGEHSITLKVVENGGMEGIRVLLKDLIENEEQFLSMNPIYYFEANVDDPVNRFEIELSEGPLGIADNIENEYMVYSFNKTIKIKSIEPSINKIFTVQIFDISGRMIKELKNIHDREIAIPLDLNYSTVIVRLITDNGVINKKLFIE